MKNIIELNPIRKDKVWGYEDWIISTHFCAVQKELIQNAGEQDILVKIIQANDVLSVQLHPDDETAKILEGEGERGKTECWYVLSAEKDARLVYGVKNGATKEKLSRAINEKRLEEYLSYLRVNAGDFVYIPSGMVHAIGGGFRLLEVQQSCDITYRFYDWGRKRELHIEKGLSSIKIDEKGFVGQPFSGFFEGKYFSLKRICVDSFVKILPSKSLWGKKYYFLFVIEGEGKIETGEEEALLVSEKVFAVSYEKEVRVSGRVCLMKIEG